MKPERLQEIRAHRNFPYMGGALTTLDYTLLENERNELLDYIAELESNRSWDDAHEAGYNG